VHPVLKRAGLYLDGCVNGLNISLYGGQLPVPKIPNSHHFPPFYTFLRLGQKPNQVQNPKINQKLAFHRRQEV